MSEQTKIDGLAGYAMQAAALIRLPLAPEHLPGVIANLTLAARMAAITEAMPITPIDEAAPVFVAARDAPR